MPIATSLALKRCLPITGRFVRHPRSARQRAALDADRDESLWFLNEAPLGGLVMTALTSLRVNISLLSLIAGLILISSTAGAQNEYRVDAYPIPTMTITQTQFLKGEKNGQAATVAGCLKFQVL